ncbi:MAG: RNA-guided endonuclease TnpB family protein [Patescibacteria group bacterium]|jgi:putative transposase
MQKTYKYRLYPSKIQEDILARTFGSCRFVYNHALEYRKNLYNSEKKSIYYNDLASDFLLSLKEENPFLKEVPSQTLQQSLRHQDTAYINFFKHGAGFPKFKSRYNKQTCSFPQGVRIDFSKGKIFLPYLKWTKAKLHRSFEGTIKTCTLTKTTTEKYYISILVENNIPNPEFIFGPNIIGIDLGIKDFAVFSDKEKIANPKTYNKHLRKIQKLQRQLSLKTKGSNNYKKIKLLLSREHEKISNVRSDFLHKESLKIINKNHVIIMENLSVKDLLEKSPTILSRYIADCSWSTFVNYIKYKAEFYGKKLVQIGRFEPSSKTCSICGKVNKELQLNDREWTCSCGACHDRDINAAINILKFGMEQPEFKALLVDVSQPIGSPFL